MNRSHVIRLNSSPEQEVYFRKACGVARHTYNWALARWKEYRAEGKWAKMKDLKVEYNSIKGEQFPWVYEVTKMCTRARVYQPGTGFCQLLADEGGGDTSQAETPTQGWRGRWLSTFQKQETG